MCTAVSFLGLNHYFGRNLDLEYCYHEAVTITPRNFPLRFRNNHCLNTHYAIIGVSTISESYPLYYDGTNEAGLSVAGLNFPDNAVYNEPVSYKNNITPYEFIPWILAKCNSVANVRLLLAQINLVNINFKADLPLTPLHWLISDTHQSIVVESVKDGLKIYDNPFDILTNNPPFDYHCINLSNYMKLHPGPVKSEFNPSYPLQNYSLGMGAMGLPGDFSSTSRIVRGFFVKENSVAFSDENSNVTQFFHIMNSVAMPKGCVQVGDAFEYTRYTCCCNVNKGIYYYNTYDMQEIVAINMHEVDLDYEKMVFF